MVVVVATAATRMNRVTSCSRRTALAIAGAVWNEPRKWRLFVRSVMRQSRLKSMTVLLLLLPASSRAAAAAASATAGSGLSDRDGDRALS